MNNILVTGANGQLGSELQVLATGVANTSFFFTDVDDLDITNYQALESYLTNNKITTVINCAAYTAVDAAEEHKDLANAINHLAVVHIATLCKKLEIKLIHISTDYIFDGTNHKPYLETDRPNPQSVYGKTKYDGEQGILNIKPPNTIIIRTAWVYSSFGNNFVKTMLRLATQHKQLSVIADQVGSPTYAKNLAEAILELLPQIHNTTPELLHYTNEGVSSWYDFAKAIFEIKQINIPVNAIETKDYPTLAKRPYYSVLNTSKIKNTYKLSIPNWRQALETCLNKIES